MADIREFQSFRETGELSDITICLGNKEFKLHQFPLYARSAYIKAFVVDHGDDENPKITLENFPGGEDTFTLAADFCYGIHININPNNVIALRCAAEILEMAGPGNLISKTVDYIGDILAAARLTRNSSQIITLLTTTFDLGETAEKLNISEKCIEALVEMWLKGPTSRYTLTSTSSYFRGATVQDKLLELPKNWFIQLITKARDAGAKSTLWGECVQKYIARQFDEVRKQKKAAREAAALEEQQAAVEAKVQKDALEAKALKDTSEATVQKEAEETQNPKETPEEETEAPKTAEQQGAQDTASEAATEEVTQEPKAETIDQIEENVAESKPKTEVVDTSTATERREPKSVVDDMDHEEQEEFSKVLDSVLSELPDDAPLAHGISPTWVVDSLAIASKFDCACRGKLLNLACQVLPKLPRSDVAKFEPVVMIELVEKVSSVDGCDTAAIALVSDTYLLDKVKQGFEDIEIVQALVAATRKEDRTNYDVLFEVIETLMAGKDRQEEGQLTEDQTSTLFAVVEFQKLSEETLQRAYDSKIVPEAHITKAALALCGKLRTQLDTAKSIVRMQEEELQRIKYGSLPSYRSVLPLESVAYPRADVTSETADLYGSPPNYNPSFVPLDSSYSDYALDKSVSESYTRPLQKPDISDDYVARRLHWSLRK